MSDTSTNGVTEGTTERAKSATRRQPSISDEIDEIAPPRMHPREETARDAILGMTPGKARDFFGFTRTFLQRVVDDHAEDSDQYTLRPIKASGAIRVYRAPVEAPSVFQE